MGDLADGESVEMKGSAAKPYELKNTGGVYSCSCPAWRNQSVAIERRTCKHLRKLRGAAEEDARCGKAESRKTPAEDGDGEEGEGPPLLLAQVWDTSTDLTGWWMSEKLDGVRAYWQNGQFLSRLGNRYFAPDWFIQGLPDVPLDGELWGGRKKFQRTVSIVRRQDKSDQWKELSFVVFDAPTIDAPFEERVAFCQRHLSGGRAPYARHHDHIQCRGTEHLKAELTRVEALGGEGLMLRQPASRYEVGRSSTLLKVKSFHDAEARVIDHLDGEGRHKGRLGALLVELPNGTPFSVGTGFSDAERRNPPPRGSIITFRYQELSDGGVPRFPSYVGIRGDVALPPKK
jgi:DNA ligase-1